MISFKKIVDIAQEVKDKSNLTISEFILNNEDMDIIFNDFRALRSYNHSKEVDDNNEINFKWSDGIIKLKREAKRSGVSLYVLVDEDLRIMYSGSYNDVESYHKTFYDNDKNLKVIELKGEV